MPDDASRALVSAALAGLLCVAVNACSSESEEGTLNAALDAGAGGVNTGGSAGSGSGGSAGALVDASIADAVADSAAEQDSEPSADASDAETSAETGVVCDDAGTDAAGVISSSTVVPDMTLEKFTADCDALGGTVEIHPHCGGENSCKGMSYDTGTLTYTEHTCKGLNTCAGYSCVLCK